MASPAYYVGGGVMVLAGIVAFLMLRRVAPEHDVADEHPHPPVPPHHPVHYVRRGSFAAPGELGEPTRG